MTKLVIFLANNVSIWCQAILLSFSFLEWSDSIEIIWSCFARLSANFEVGHTSARVGMTTFRKNSEIKKKLESDYRALWVESLNRKSYATYYEIVGANWILHWEKKWSQNGSTPGAVSWYVTQLHLWHYFGATFKGGTVFWKTVPLQRVESFFS